MTSIWNVSFGAAEAMVTHSQLRMDSSLPFEVSPVICRNLSLLTLTFLPNDVTSLKFCFLSEKGFKGIYHGQL